MYMDRRPFNLGEESPTQKYRNAAISVDERKNATSSIYTVEHGNWSSMTNHVEVLKMKIVGFKDHDIV